MTVIDTAQNGREAVDKALQLRRTSSPWTSKCRCSTASAPCARSAKCPTPILMFPPSPTGAKATLDALDAGALDFLPKIRRHRPGQGRGGQPAAAAGQDRPQAFPDDDPAPGARAPGAARPRRCPDPPHRAPARARACTERPPASSAAAKLPAGGHRHLHRWPGGAAKRADQAAGRFSPSDPVNPAYAGHLHRGLRRPSQRPVPDRGQGRRRTATC